MGRLRTACVVVACLIATTLPADDEYYRERPLIGDVPLLVVGLPPAAREERNRYYRAMVRLNANVHATSPDSHIFYLGRDGEYLHDLAQVLYPEARERHHLINISRAIYQKPEQRPLILRYLREQGILRLLERGEPVVFVDTGWRGLMMKELLSILREHYADRPAILEGLRGEGGLIRIHFAFATARVEDEDASLRLRIPSSRAFLTSLDPRAERIDPTAGRNTWSNRARIKAIENRVPHFTRTATQLVEVEDVILGERVGSHLEPTGDWTDPPLAGLAALYAIGAKLSPDRRYLAIPELTWSRVARLLRAGQRESGLLELDQAMAMARLKLKRPTAAEREALEELEEEIEVYRRTDRVEARRFMADMRAFGESADGKSLDAAERRWWERFHELESGAREAFRSRARERQRYDDAHRALRDFLRSSLTAGSGTPFLPRAERGEPLVFAEARVRDALQQLTLHNGWNNGRQTPRLDPEDVDPRLDREFVPKQITDAAEAGPPDLDVYRAHLRSTLEGARAAKRLADSPLSDPESRRRTELALAELGAVADPAMQREHFVWLLDFATLDRLPPGMREPWLELADRSFRHVSDPEVRARWLGLATHENGDVALAATLALHETLETLTLGQARELVEQLLRPEVLTASTLVDRLLEHARSRLLVRQEPEWAVFVRELPARIEAMASRLPGLRSQNEARGAAARLRLRTAAPCDGLLGEYSG